MHPVPLTALLLAATLAGCTAAPRAAAPEAPKPTRILLDGDIADWPVDQVAFADEHYVYFRFAVEGEPFTLQAAPQTTALLIDCDGRADTGLANELDPLEVLGVDLELRFSPRDAAGKPIRGVSLAAVDASGTRTPLKPADFDLSFAPTYAATWYEGRISRTPVARGPLPLAGMFSAGELKGLVALLDASGEIDGYSDPFTLDIDRACASGERLTTLDIPAKPSDALRVLSYNVENSGPVERPEAFKRLFEAIDPDLILLQEWETGDEAAVLGWFTAMIPSDTGWHVRKAPGTKGNGGGVVIISAYPIAPAGDDRLRVLGEPGPAPVKEYDVRFVAARVDTPHGRVLVGNTHLKCCGTKDSPEDRRRMAEARAINAALRAAADDPAVGPAPIRILAGDLNLVGTRPPLDLARAGLDADGSDLAVAQPQILGESAFTTWRDADTTFLPGRLDYILYGDAAAEAVNAFVLDTARLTDEALARCGLDREDTAGASDHRPVVVDLRPRTNPLAKKSR